MNITIETTVSAPLERVWEAWTTPDDIEQWNAASDDWHCPAADIDLTAGGSFVYRMESRDGSMGFDFTGVFSKLVTHQTIEFVLGDGRPVTVEFIANDDAVTVRETFETESEHTGEQQRKGWQAILDNFARYVEAKPR